MAMLTSCNVDDNTATDTAHCPPLIVEFLETKFGPVDRIEQAKSAQQQVLLVAAARRNVAVRRWKGGSRWWNLHQAGHPEQLARSEVAGYRIARRCLGQSIRIPEVLHFDRTDLWAVLEHVGDIESLDDAWTAGMIKTRMEFGFLEPHPRWGRVPVDEAVEYALTVLRSVTLPLHRWMNDVDHSTIPDIEDLSGWKEGGYTFAFMIKIYRNAYKHMENALEKVSVEQSTDLRLSRELTLLQMTIQQLEQDALRLDPPSLPPVLWHMDCQPQNLLFARSQAGRPLKIASVLDWEEAAYADPRFELLLLGRKVCANRAQADKIWKVYQEELPQLKLGPIEPWLKLETVHSLTTLLLQSMDLLGGGRSPWETKPDLRGKIERESRRLVVYADWTVFDDDV
jgi:Phosphotransferase enzyme family